MSPSEMRRLLVLGSSGSGKSTVTAALGRALGIEAVHLDTYYWQPNWTATPADEWRSIVHELLNRDSWVMDGNYPDLLEMRLKRADTVVFLDYPRLICLWRCVKRYFHHRNTNRPELADGCYEKIDWDFIKWIWGYPRHVKPRVLETIMGCTQGIKTIRLKGDQQVKRFLAEIGAS